MASPRAFWGVVSVGNPLRPIESIVESLEQAERLMDGHARYSLRVFDTRHDAEAYLDYPTAPRWLEQGPPAEMEDDDVIDCDASSSGTEGGSDSDSSGGGWAAASAVAAVAAIGGGGAGRGGGGGGGIDLFGAGPLPDEREGPGPKIPRPTTEWVDRKIKELLPDCELDPIQRQVIDDVLVHNRNIFLTGSGGVGKSFVTKLLIDLLKAHYGFDYSWRVCVTASTGIAATHVDGATLHSAMGIGIPSSWAHFKKIFNMDNVNKKRWSRHYEVLFVDEVSMVAGEMLDALDDILRQVRKFEEAAFGGIQLVFVGDLAQLSPIQEKLERYNEQHFLARGQWDFPRHGEFWNMPVVNNESFGAQEPLFTNRGFVVESDAWWLADLKIVELTRVFRQKDADFIERLNRMRKGQTRPQDVAWMNANFFTPYRHLPLQSPLQSQPLQSPPGASAASPAPAVFAVGVEEPAHDPDPLHLYATNKDVEHRNKVKMEALPYEEKTITADDFVAHDFAGVYPRFGPDPFLENDAHVQGVKQLRNNTLFYNRVLAAQDVKLKVGAKVILLKNLDLASDKRLVNGSIGTVIRWASGPKEVDYDSVTTIIDGKMGSPSKHERKSVLKHKEERIQKWLEANPTKVPIVRFVNGRVKAIHPDIFSENIVGVGATCRIQMPLRIAFAVSIHKSQGMTLDQALVDVEKCFTGGQTYVAISRVGPREGLHFKQPLTMRRIKTEPTFLLWERLRLEMELLRAAVLELLPPTERPMVESLGLKSLHQYVQDTLKAKDSSRELRTALARLNNALGKLKPGKRPSAQAQLQAEDERMRQRGAAGRGVDGIPIWQMLPWLKRNGRWQPSMPPRDAASDATASSPGSA